MSSFKLKVLRKKGAKGDISGTSLEPSLNVDYVLSLVVYAIVPQ